MNEPEMGLEPASASTPADNPVENTALVTGTPVVVWWSFTHRLSARLIENTSVRAVIVAPIRDPFEIGFQVRIDDKGNETKGIASVEGISRLEDGAFRIELTWVD